MAKVCAVCNQEIGLLDVCYPQEGIITHTKCVSIFEEDPEAYGGVITALIKEKTESKRKNIDGKEVAEQKIKISNIKLTTAFTFNNYEIEDEIGIVTAECVFGMNIFRDFFAGMTDFFGGRSEASQKVLRDARNSCLNELKLEAHSLGADGIIGIDLDYSEISGKGKGMLFLVASGTAVTFKNGDTKDG